MAQETAGKGLYAAGEVCQTRKSYTFIVPEDGEICKEKSQLFPHFRQTRTCGRDRGMGRAAAYAAALIPEDHAAG